MRTIYGCYTRKVLVLWIVLTLLGIFGMLSNASGTDTDLNDSGGIARSPRATKIGTYLELWDSYNNVPHDGVYGDGDPGDNYQFYLNTDHYISLQLKNIYDGPRLENIECNLQVASGTGEVVKVTSQYDYEYSMYQDEVDSFYFQFHVGTSAYMRPYELEVKIDFEVIDSNYNRIEKSGLITFSIQLTSKIKSQSSGPDLRLQALNRLKQPVSLYSGTKNQLLTLPNIYSAGNNLRDLEFTLSMPSIFTMLSRDAMLDELTTYYGSNEEPLWLLNDAGSVYEKPKEYSATCKISYEENGLVVTERNVPIYIDIARTPILSLEGQIEESDIGSMSGNNYVANAAIYQGTTSKSFSIGFKNDGNVDLKDVEVELFTDNAGFFFKSKFYYDENNQAAKLSYGKTMELGDMNQGQLIRRDFPTEIIKNLPPGLYRIPVRYSAKYSPGGFVEIDLDVDDYHDDIVAARSEDNEGFTPYILVNVKEGDDPDDTTEPDLLAVSNTYLQPGMRGVELEVELTNLENYRISNVNALIEADEDCPLQALNHVNETMGKIYPNEKEFTLYGASDMGVSNKKTLHFIADVKNNARTGLNDVSLSVTCYDPYNQYRETTADISMNIQPIPPKFIINNAETSEIKPNKNFTLTLDVYNSGGSDASNVQLMFNGSSNLFSATKKIEGPKLIRKMDSEDFTFQLVAGDVISGTTYTSSIFISYEDSLGNINNFDPDRRLVVPLQVKKEDPSWAPRFIVTDAKTSDIKPNKEFSLRVTLINCGGSDAQNVRVMFNGSSNLFSATENIQTLKTIKKFQDAEFEFKIKAGDVEPGTIYSSSVFISFEDNDGKFYTFDSNPEQAITLRAKKSDSQPLVIPEGVALVVLGLFILISAIIIGFFRGRAVKKEKPGKDIDEEQRVPTPGKAKPKRFGGFGRKKSTVIDMTPEQYQPPAPTQPPPQQATYQPTYQTQEPTGYQSRADWQDTGRGYQDTSTRTPYQAQAPSAAPRPYQQPPRQPQQGAYY